MIKVMKSGGGMEAFDGQKLKGSIRKAAVDAGLTEARTKKVVAAVYKDVYSAYKGEVRVASDALKSCVLADLERIAPEAAKAWRRFDRKYKRC
jgi:transcriptional regulator NrdR family protein